MSNSNIGRTTGALAIASQPGENFLPREKNTQVILMPQLASTILKLSLVLLCAAAFVAVVFGRSSVVNAIEPESAGDMQASVYRANCARCHGNDGHSNTPAGRETDADDLTTGKVKGMSAGRMSSIIRNGKGDMPAFRKKLSAAQISGLVRYVKSL